MSATLQLIVQAAARGARNAHSEAVAGTLVRPAPDCVLPSRRWSVPALSRPALSWPTLSWPARVVRRRISAYRTRLALSALDDRALADIGLRRCEIHRVCARP